MKRPATKLRQWAEMAAQHGQPEALREFRVLVAIESHARMVHLGPGSLGHSGLMCMSCDLFARLDRLSALGVKRGKGKKRSGKGGGQ
jgi:hypothetical protein